MKRILTLLTLAVVLSGMAGAGWYSGITTPTIADGSVTNAKLATAVKVGNLSNLTTSVGTDVVVALNEVDANADAAQSTADTANTTANAAYVKPESGITEDDLASTVTDNLTLASTAMQGSTSVTDLYIGTVQLNGWAYTPVAFQADGNATITGATAAVNLSGTGNGGTILLTIDSGAEDTATLNCAVAHWDGATSATEDMHLETDTKFNISIDGGAEVTVTCDWTGCTNGTLTAAAMETAIQTATSGSETVAFSTNKYVITGTTYGTDGSVVITRAATLDACDELDIIDGAETAGTGDCGDVTAVTVDELVTLLEGDIEGATFTNASGTLTATSDTAGRGSRVLAGAGSINTAVGFPNAEVDFGEIGLDYTADMSDTNYVVLATEYGAAVASGDDLSITTKATSGFRITAETTSNTDYVGLIVAGVGA